MSMNRDGDGAGRRREHSPRPRHRSLPRPCPIPRSGERIPPCPRTQRGFDPQREFFPIIFSCFWDT